MAVLTIRNVDEEIKTSLRVRAARRGVSMEEEARRILRDVLAPADAQAPLGQRLLNRFSGLAREDFTPPGRQAPRPPPAWDDGP
ncbi:plasmid stabilization protein [Ottowia sp.]|jgi:plasmid stability protein|uniref:FitA-like ribbon-helix-helix domain-containing protein n=1 Tax=Ottowia sp. TaxID=1898956 RepID=UPI0025D0C395|nr:plasmid stabilization protein [Ottowia sp.]MBK6613132.1 plasmid stabilization protein [Ottowia sp.]MBK6747757.1 plasmid stabilization protein [Ottowia sp.]